MTKKLGTKYLKIFFIFIFILCLSLLAYNLKSNLITFDTIKNYIISSENFSAVIFIILYALKSFFVFIPSSIVVVFSGSVFGMLNGFIYSMIGSLLASTLSFYLSKFAGRDFVKKLLGKKSKYIDGKMDLHGFKILLILRLSFVIPFDILSLMSGLTKLKYRHFILGTFIGIIPDTLSLAMLGANINSPKSMGFIISTIMVILTIGVPFLYYKFKNKPETECIIPEKNTIINENPITQDIPTTNISKTKNHDESMSTNSHESNRLIKF